MDVEVNKCTIEDPKQLYNFHHVTMCTFWQAVGVYSYVDSSVCSHVGPSMMGLLTTL